MEINLHPAQLQFVAVRELFIQTFFVPSPTYIFETENGQLTARAAKFDPEKKTIQLGLEFSLGMDREPSPEEVDEIRRTSKQPFRLRVHLVGEFQIDTDRFPEEKVEQWGKVNAPAILFPFLREHVFALTSRCGYKPVILPLIVLPTIKIEAKKDPVVAEELAAPTT